MRLWFYVDCDVKCTHHAVIDQEDSMTTAQIQEEDEVILVDLQPAAGVP
jgi:hypothetical protein